MRPIRLTKREYEVLTRLALSNIEIADELGTKESNVAQICKSIFAKLNVHSRAGAIIQAQKYELVHLYNFIL